MAAATKPRPKPKPTRTTGPFWEGAARGELMLQYDPATRAHQFWPRANSVRSGKRNLKWRAASGRGTLYSYTVTHVPAAGFEDETPYVVGLVELDEGVRVIGNVRDASEDEVAIGMRLKVVWEKIGDDAAYFAFAPDRDA